VADVEHEHFGQLFREIRKAHRLTQMEVAREAGMLRHQLCHIELHVTDPQWSTVQRLARAACIPIGQLKTLKNYW